MTDTKLLVQKRMATVLNTVASYCNDGYLVLVSYKSEYSMVYRLRHKSNSNMISILAEPVKNHQKITSKNRIVYDGKITKK